LRGDEIGTPFNVGQWKFDNLIPKRGICLAHDCAGRLGLCAILFALCILRENVVPVGRQEDAAVIAFCFGFGSYVARQREIAKRQVTQDIGNAPVEDGHA
tara:strand:+ start:3806 stop:4105 length:300 start_codon:yes stop_codon:yes gene_type:complete